MDAPVRLVNPFAYSLPDDPPFTVLRPSLLPPTVATLRRNIVGCARHDASRVALPDSGAEIGDFGSMCTSMIPRVDDPFT